MSETPPDVRIGTSGWSYNDWSPDPYPEGLPVAKRRDVYAQHFDTVELNASFYRWPPKRNFETWHDKFPPGFKLTVKAPKTLTHMAKLKEPERWAEMFANDWAALGDKAGIFLVQLAPFHERDDEALAHLLDVLPLTMRVAVEFRHDSWHCDDVQAILREHRAAYVVMSGPKLPCNLWATTDFVYVRFHGPDDKRLYWGQYNDDEMNWWGERCREWRDSGHEIWAYFNNDYHANAIRNARQLLQQLGTTPYQER